MKTIPSSSSGAHAAHPFKFGHSSQPVQLFSGLTPAQAESDPATPVRTAEHSFLEKVRVIVCQTKLDDNLCVQGIASALFLSRVQVFRKIKALTGASPSCFIRRIRLHLAVEMLNNSNNSIADIAYNVGFSDPKYFSRVFAREFGYPPSLLRKNLNAGE